MLALGADLAGLCREAAICALRNQLDETQTVKHAHFEAAQLEIRPSICRQDLAVYEDWRKIV